LFSFIPSIIIVQFFRRIRLRRTDQIKRPEIQTTDKKKSKLTFPWWCLFIVYGLCFILMGISSVFIIARGIEFDDLKSQKWLTSILTGFFSSIILIQPIKVKLFFRILMKL
jgi:hypothetical protein